jgi:hypothetical protein
MRLIATKKYLNGYSFKFYFKGSKKETMKLLLLFSIWKNNKSKVMAKQIPSSLIESYKVVVSRLKFEPRLTFYLIDT